MSQVALAAGMQVTPSVRLLRPLGGGGMGAVWLADHTALNTQVVVKFMVSGLDSSAGARARFKREAEAASQVKSPHVVQTFDYGLTTDDVPFIVMEHLEGRDLAAEIAARGSLAASVVVSVVTQVAKALTKAHAVGVLHRDIKPENIFLCHADDDEEEFFVKLLDFGIAKSRPADGEASLDGDTKTGQVVGTPYYMSPEQVTAQKVVDKRSDLWALGVVAYEALTGTRPFDGPSFGALAVKIATTDPKKPSEIVAALPSAVDTWFAKACAREPADRFSSARDLAEGLRSACEGLPSVPKRSVSMSDSGPRDPARKVDDERPSKIALAETQNPSEAHVEGSALARSEPGARTASLFEGDALGTAPARKGARRVVALALAASIGVIVVSVVVWPSRDSRRANVGVKAEDSGTRAPAVPAALDASVLHPTATASADAPDAGEEAHVAPPPSSSAKIGKSEGGKTKPPSSAPSRPRNPPATKSADDVTRPPPRTQPTSHDDPLF